MMFKGIIYIALVLLLMSLAQAVTINATGFPTVPQSAGTSAKYGYQFIPMVNMTGTYSGLWENSESTQIYLYNFDCSALLKQVAVSNYEGFINYNLTKGTTYIMLADNGGVARSLKYNPAPEAYPFNKSDINITSGVNGLCGFVTDQWNEFKYLTYTTAQGETTNYITLENPVNNEYNSSLIMNFTYVPVSQGGFNIDNCSLNLNNSAPITDLSITNNTVNLFENVVLSEAIYRYNISCIDEGSNEFISDNRQLTIDVSAPTLYNLSFSGVGGFNNKRYNASIICTDTVALNLNYAIEINGAVLFNATVPNNQKQNVSFNVIDGNNTLIGYCSDAFNTVTNNTDITVYSKILNLIDEQTNDIFDVDNLTSGIIYADDNSTSYNFKTANTTQINYTTTNYTKLRFEFGYADSPLVTRYIDTSLLTNNARICAFKNTVPSYTNLVYSTTTRKVVLKNNYANCYAVADYTRFAYQDVLTLPIKTIESTYKLYTEEDGNDIYLASVDGTSTTQINLDTLIFSGTSYNINVFADSLNFKKYNSTHLQVYYNNMKGDNTDLSMTITNLDNGNEVYSESDFADNNEFTLYLDYSGFGANSTTIFKSVMVKTKPTTTETSKKYFNLNAKEGTLRQGLGLTIAFLLTIFGLTFTVQRLTFSWFGIVICLTSIFILASTIGGWQVTFLMYIDAIVMIFILLNYLKEETTFLT
jgi:hypothetical protein